MTQSAPPSRFRRRPLASVLFLTATLLFGAGEASGQSGVSLALGTTAPDVTLEDLDGNEVQLLEVLDGRPGLIEFWASWCEQCEALQPTIDEVHERFGDQVQVVAVAVAVAQSQRRVRRHVEEHGAGFPYLWDGNGEAVRAYQAAATSIVVLVDGDGKIAYTGVGPSQDLVGEVESVLSSER